MRHGIDESPLNPLPAAIWALVLPIIAAEIAFGLASAGFMGGGGQGIGLRSAALERTAFAPEMLLRMWQYGEVHWSLLLRLLTFPFIHYGLTHAAFVVVFALAFGKQLAEVFRPSGVVILFFGCAVGGALAYTLLAAVLPFRLNPLVGGYPAVYGFVGAFTFLLWTRLAQTGGNRFRAFALIGMLLIFQLVFGLVFGNAGTAWMAEIAGFCFGFLLSPLVLPGGIGRFRRILRQR